MGLNNLKNTDYVNVVIQALAHIIPVRNFFLQPDLYSEAKSQMVRRRERRLWGKGGADGLSSRRLTLFRT